MVPKKLKKIGAIAFAALSLILSNNLRAISAPEFVDQSPLGQELNLPVCEWKDSTVSQKAIIFALHGATLYAKTFDESARHFAAEGYPFYALDMRGFGRWRDPKNTFGGDSGIHYTQTKVDAMEVLGMLKRLHPNTKIYVLGESLGANLAIWLVTNQPEMADGAILSSPCIKRVLHPSPWIVVDVTKGFFHPYEGHDLRRHIEPYLSDDKRVTAHYMSDPMINRMLSAADLLKSMRTNNDALLGADKMPADTPLLVVAGKKDQVYKASAIEPFMKRAGSQHKTVFIEPNKGHLLLETGYTEPKILSVIDDWLNEETTKKEISRVPD